MLNVVRLSVVVIASFWVAWKHPERLGDDWDWYVPYAEVWNRSLLGRFLGAVVFGFLLPVALGFGIILECDLFWGLSVEESMIWQFSFLCGIVVGLYCGVPERWFSDWMNNHPLERCMYCLLMSLFGALLGCAVAIVGWLVGWCVCLLNGWDSPDSLLGLMQFVAMAFSLIGLIIGVTTKRRPLYLIAIRFSWTRFRQLARRDKLEVVKTVTGNAAGAAFVTYVPLYYLLYWIGGLPNSVPPGSGAASVRAAEVTQRVADILRQEYATLAIVGSLVTFITMVWLGPWLWCSGKGQPLSSEMITPEQREDVPNH
jgi:hypothetical protein